jgi:multidrug resistance protein
MRSSTLRQSRSAVVVLVTFATFIDIVAYSVAVPVLPDLSRKLGASATVIGFLFASFGVTVLAASVPMGAISDRLGRKGPMVGGLLALAAATVLFAFADRLPLLFVARLVQGAADAVTWVVGFALVADLYGPAERGRVMGLVMSGTGFGFMIGPTFGGWLYEMGGMQLPFLGVAGFALIGALAFVWLEIPSKHTDLEVVPFSTVIQVPAVMACAAAVVVGGGTVAMFEPMMSLHLADAIGLGPARVGLVFGGAAVASILLHPLAGRLADRLGSRRLTIAGLIALACMLPVLGRIWNFESAVFFTIVNAAAMAMLVTPSLAYMAEATSAAGVGSFGAAYGVYNFAWAIGLLAGPAAGGVLYELVGFERLVLLWAPLAILSTLAILVVERRRPHERFIERS